MWLPIKDGSYAFHTVQIGQYGITELKVQEGYSECSLVSLQSPEVHPLVLPDSAPSDIDLLDDQEPQTERCNMSQFPAKEESGLFTHINNV